MNNYVLGTGISGLITGYITGFKVIGSKVGGQLATPFDLGPRILEKDTYSERLLKALDISEPSKIYNIGYKLNDSVSSVPPEGFRDKYYKYTRGIDGPSGSSMSGNRNIIEGWDLRELKLIEKLESELAKNNQLIKGKIIEIDKGLIYCTNAEMPYDKIISTIPLPSLDLILNGPRNDGDEDNVYDAKDTVFVKVRKYKILADLTHGFDYIYVLDGSPFHRITKLGDNEYVLEARVDRLIKDDEHVDLDIGPGVMLIDTQTIKRCQIINSLDVNWFNGIRCIGRYAQWSHKIKIEDVIKEAYDYAEQMGL